MKIRANKKAVRGYSFQTAVACGYVPGQPQSFWKRIWNRLRLKTFPLHPPKQEVRHKPSGLDLTVLEGDGLEYQDINFPIPPEETRRKLTNMLQSFRMKARRDGMSTEALDRLAAMQKEAERSWQLGLREPRFDINDQLRHVFEVAQGYNPKTDRPLVWAIWNCAQRSWLKNENGKVLKTQDLYYVIQAHTRYLNKGAVGLEIRQYIDENNAVPEVSERVDAGSNPFETDSQRPEQG